MAWNRPGLGPGRPPSTAGPALAMRDTDRTASVVVVPADSSIRHWLTWLERPVATGRSTRPRPPAAAGAVQGIDDTSGASTLAWAFHGDHVGGERDAARAWRPERSTRPA